MMVGSECSKESEPYIISVALSSQQVWEGPDDWSWMGTIVAGEKFIHARKLRRGGAENMYVETDQDYYLMCEDVRLPNMQHKEVPVRRSARQLAAPANKTFEFDLEEIETLQLRCWRRA
jgi:hypothetical protein